MHNAFIDRLGWTLIHSIWQGIAISILLGGGLLSTRKKTANIRYCLSYSALIAIAVSAVTTFVILAPPPNLSSTVVKPSESTIHKATSGLSHITAQVIANGEKQFDIQSYFPLVVTIWVIGVTLLTIRLLGGIFQVEFLKRRSVQPETAEWQIQLDLLSIKLGIHQNVKLLVSETLQIPATMGVFRSIVIMPLSVMTKLTQHEIESLFLHELAHIRRHDYLLNLIQTLIETALFYHPAVWWVTRVVRSERENCCDDIAATSAASPIVYARALTSLEELRGFGPTLSMSAKGGFLMKRINRILGIANPPARPPKALPSAAVLIGIVAVLGFVVEGFAQSNPPKPSAPAKTSHSKNGSQKQQPKKAGASSRVVALVHSKPKLVVGQQLPGTSIALKTTLVGISGNTPNKPIKQPMDHSNESGKPATPKALETIVVGEDATADLINSDFATAIQTVARQTGTSFVIAPNGNFSKVSVRFIKVPAVEAFNAVCFAGGASWHKQGNILYFEKRRDDQDTITDHVTLHLKHVTLREAANQMARLLGATITVDKGIYDDYFIDVNMENLPVTDAMFELCQSLLSVREKPSEGFQPPKEGYGISLQNMSGGKVEWHCTNGVYNITFKR